MNSRLLPVLVAAGATDESARALHKELEMRTKSTMISSSIQQPSPWEWPALASGILLAALQVAWLAFFGSTIAPKLPPLDAPAAQTAALFRETADASRILNYLGALQMPFLLLFLGGLFAVLRRAEGSDAVLATSAVAAGVAMVLIPVIMMSVESYVATALALQEADPRIVRAFDGMGPISWALSGFPRALLLAATSAVLLRGGIGARWIGWAGLILGLLSLVGTGTLLERGLFPLLPLGSVLFALWTLALSISLLRHPGAPVQLSRADQPSESVAA